MIEKEEKVMRKLGILLPIFSLPSKTGVGDFGKEAYTFIDYLVKAGIKIWQILPLNPLGEGNSPYQSASIYAMDEIYISLELLQAEHFLVEVRHFQQDSERIDYAAVRNFKKAYLERAFLKFKPDEDYKRFIQQEWVYEYAVFRVFKQLNTQINWYDWSKKYKNWPQEQAVDLTLYEQEIAYQLFLQYVLYKQWQKLKMYANEHGIEIMGDMPIYAGYDSVDVWAHRYNYLLDASGKSTYVAGVGPDYFSEKGQLWGNPLYDWNYLAKNHFQFWIDRLRHSQKIFDLVRIDHFRAFDTYWQIPADEVDARNGVWIEAPGYALFDEIYRQLHDIQIVAEDLGELRPEVLELRDFYHLKGMKVLQYMFDVQEREFNDIENMIAYTGTHDNQTLVGWLKTQDTNIYQQFFMERGYNNKHLYEDFIEYTIASIHTFVIIPLQDFLGKDDIARINIPGEINEHNWNWKLRDFNEFDKKIALIKRWCRLHGR